MSGRLRLHRRLRAAAALVAAAAGVAPAAQAADYSFDLSEIAPSPWQASGFVEAKAESFRLRSDAALYPLTFAGATPRRTLDRGTASFELAGRYKQGIFTAQGRITGTSATDSDVTNSTGAVLEAVLRASPAEGLSFDVGKQVQRWGKGYAWSPVAFFERPKDPNDPQLSREGYVMVSADAVKSLSGTLAAVGFTPVVLPVSSDLNRDFGMRGHTNVGAKLYLLWDDTDIDLLWAARGSRPERVGLDFSRNFGNQLEVHGEWARTLGATLRDLGAGGSVTTHTGNADSWLLGARYLTENEITFIAEFYRNGGGQDDGQLASFYGLLDSAFGPAGTQALQAQVRSLAQSGYARTNPGRHYAYLRVAVKDPFDWLYLTPALTTIVNLDDHSFQVTPEVLYTGWQNVELRARAIVLKGRNGSEFGEKPAARRLELALKLYF